MNKLEDIVELRLYFFGTEQQKKAVFFEFIIPFFDKMKIPYYAERDWFGGPCYRIIHEYPEMDIGWVEKEFAAFCEGIAGSLTKEALEQNLKAYKTNTPAIAQMERREYREVKVDNHLSVESDKIDAEYVKKRFNSFQHLKVHIQSLFHIQSFMSGNLESLKSLSSGERIKYTARFYRDVLQYSQYEEKYSVLVYVSNIEGVLAIADTRGKKEAYIQTYEKVYDFLNPEQFFQEEDYEDKFGRQWKQTLTAIYSLITDNLDILLHQHDEGYFSPEEQNALLKQNISQIESGFHDELLNNSIDDLLKHREHSIFKYLINIIYKFIHMLGIPFNEKNAACYIVCKYILDKRGTTWKQILDERGESFAR
ncbi:hypothetical protein [Bacillus sp. P14.5]|uniref:hypothetical protein n=1 Tax=Bacillus sp. P14.5 TaxID=1983400 RepID=UPI000DE91C1F|nr:hypothetical protein [Bacillus sp. P14.5]